MCKRCGSPLPVKTGRGRPLSYCSTSCRKAAAREKESPEVRERRRERDRVRGKKGICAGGCGKPVWIGSTSQAEPICRACRKVRRQRTCEQCGAGFEAIPSRVNARFCSQPCLQAWEVEHLTKEIEHRICANPACGKGFEVHWRLNTQSDKRFCSHSCYHDNRRKPVPVLPAHPMFVPLRVCAECGHLIVGDRTWRVTCGDECARKRQSRQTSEGIMKRYYSDPEFRADMGRRAQNRRVSKLGLAGITTPKALLLFLIERDGGICQALTCLMDREDVFDDTGPGKPSMDHIVPLALGGEHTVENLQLTHFRCNLSKGARFIG